MPSPPNIAIIAPGNNNFSETFIEAHKKLLSGNIYYYYGNNSYFPIYLEGAGPLVLKGIDKISDFGRRIIHKILKRHLVRYYSKGQETALVRSFQRKKIDLVLAEYGQTGALCMPACRRLNIPLIVHFHGLDASIHSVIEEYERLYHEMFLYSSKIIVVSSIMRDKLIALGASQEKIALNPYGPDGGFFSIKRDHISSNFIFIGRFVDKKAPYLAIMAFKQVVESNPEARLKMIGDGPLMNVCVNMAKSLHLQDKIIFLGICSPEQVKQEMLSSVALVQHSVTALNGDMEGTPVAILEGSAASLPIISTFHAGIPDVVQQHVTGYLVNELDVDGMAQAMLDILANPKKGLEMGERGRERIMSEFSMDKHIGALNQIITETIGRR